MTTPQKLGTTLYQKIFNRENARWLLSLGLMLAAATSFRSAIADWNDVPTGSMQPTILIGDRILVNKLAYDLKVPFTQIRLATWDDPERGDIVVFWSPADGERLVKRVVGVPGDRIAMKDGRLWLNGSFLDYEADVDAGDHGLGEAAAEMQFYLEQLGEVEHVVAAEPGVAARRDFGPVEIPAGKYFMMGDNRDHSADSRYFGFVDRSAISGRTGRIALSLDYANWYLPRWERFFSRLV